MCGIAGFVGEGNREVLSGMVGKLIHRGPDDFGISEEGKVGFAHVRLAIIDLSPLGHQPMHSVSGNVSITFNGEIYNYRELRQELEAQGRIFKSGSDTEVILQLYEAIGEQLFTRLEGMFALALYDKSKDILFLARDRFGEKPLYYSLRKDTLVFASEPKALFVHPLVSLELNKKSVASYLTYDAVLTPESIYEGVHKLEAGSYALYTGGKLTKKTYWHPPTKIQEDLSFTDALTQLDQMFEHSIAARMVAADVPVGVFLSGGLDSSLVAYYAQKSSKTPIHTFSLGFTVPSYDESSHARKVAKHLGTIHHERMVTAEEVRGVLETIVHKLDEPIADPAILPNYLLSEFARGKVKVVLGGDAGDELFAGYQTFVAERFLPFYQSLPTVLRKKLIEPIVSALPVSHRYFSFDFKAKQFIRGAELVPRYTHQGWLESFSLEEQKEIFSSQFLELLPKNPYTRIDEYLSEMPTADTHLQTSYSYLRTYLLDVVLAKVDRTSMYHALEVRAPFLDTKLVETALTLPWHYKYRGITGKYILRKLMNDRLPESVLLRKKHGFALPIGDWLRKEWRVLLQETLAPTNVRAVGVCEPKVVSRLVNEHISGRFNHRKKLWSLLVFHLWYSAWIGRRTL